MSHYHYILDNGHGNDTPGKRSPRLPNGQQLMEFEFNRDVVQKIATALTANNISYTVLVPEVNDISLPERVRRANTLAQTNAVLISVHSNAQSDGWGSASGIETFHVEASPKGRKTAAIFQHHLIDTLNWKDRGIKTAGFYIIKHTNMPAILTENGFFSNRQECTFLLTQSYRQLIADAHVKAILELEAKMPF